MKKQLIKFSFILTAVMCLFTLPAAAQKQDDKKGDRRNPPVIKPNEDRKTKNDKEKDNDKEKKPQIVSQVIAGRAEVEVS